MLQHFIKTEQIISDSRLTLDVVCTDVEWVSVPLSWHHDELLLLSDNPLLSDELRL